MFQKKNHRWLIPLGVAVSIVVFDQITKYWIVQALGPEPLLKARPLIGDWFRLIYSQNTGVAFSLFSNMSSFFIVTSILIAAGLVYVYFAYLPNRNMFVQVSVGLIEGGAIGNTIDRIREGFVIDFIQVGWWPVFNVADSAITTGAGILALCMLLLGHEQPAPEKPRDDSLLHDLLGNDVKRR